MSDTRLQIWHLAFGCAPRNERNPNREPRNLANARRCDCEIDPHASTVDPRQENAPQSHITARLPQQRASQRATPCASHMRSRHTDLAHARAHGLPSGQPHPTHTPQPASLTVSISEDLIQHPDTTRLRLPAVHLPTTPTIDRMMDAAAHTPQVTNTPVAKKDAERSHWRGRQGRCLTVAPAIDGNNSRPSGCTRMPSTSGRRRPPTLLHPSTFAVDEGHRCRPETPPVHQRVPPHAPPFH